MTFNKLIDHTLLKPDASDADIDKLCAEAQQYDFASVCVNPHFVSRCATNLKGSNVKVCTVIGFPLGQTLTSVKVYETKAAIKAGAEEIDMVINISMLKQHLDIEFQGEIAQVKQACAGHLLKVIIETCLLSDEEKVRACRLAVRAGADYVKTSTGFASGGATIADVALMRQTVGPTIGVKASGGIRSLEDVKAMVEAGATRIGTSSGVKIMNGRQAEGGKY
ncbi:MAG TPA: deoxyribose-phosphate aldolase [Firmicutes bacterium]|nr:deoxyribose-phosphate aldolase [Bacillota bacterium]